MKMITAQEAKNQVLTEYPDEKILKQIEADIKTGIEQGDVCVTYWTGATPIWLWKGLNRPTIQAKLKGNGYDLIPSEDTFIISWESATDTLLFI